MQTLSIRDQVHAVANSVGNNDGNGVENNVDGGENNADNVEDNDVIKLTLSYRSSHPTHLSLSPISLSCPLQTIRGVEVEKEDLLGTYRTVLQEKRVLEADLHTLRCLPPQCDSR